MSALEILAIGLTATLAGTAANATQFDYNLKTASEFGGSSTLTATAGNALKFTDTTNGSTLTMLAFGGHINDVKSSTNSALNTVTATTVADWKGYGMGVLYTGDSTGNETHQIDNVGGGVDFVALVFSQAVTLSQIGLTAYPLNGASYVDADMSYMAYTGSLTDLVNGVNLANFSTASFDQTSLIRSVSSVSTTVNTNSNLASTIWLVSAAVASGDRDDGFKLTTLTVNSIPAAVPEPATWAMMLVGFGGIGGAMRSRRARQAVKVAFAD
jgi:hypothetical protein